VESYQSRYAWVTLASFQLLEIAQTDFAFLSQAFLGQSCIDAQPIEILSKGAKDFDFHFEIITALIQIQCEPLVRKRLHLANGVGSNPFLTKHDGDDLMRILILDDNPALLQVLALSLRVEGFTVTVFSSPHEVLKNIHEADVLVTDYHMPEMTGLEVARRAYAQGWSGLLFLMSGRSSAITEPTEHPLLRSLLDKPFSAHELVEKLHKL
jgi:CheY-like chemotaxis protein